MQAVEKLTILIPTYERPNELEDILSCVKGLVAKRPWVRVVISDNSQSGEARGRNKEAAQGFEYAVNSQNLGYAGNLARLLSLVSNGLVWFVSDDDQLHTQSTRKLLDKISDGFFLETDCILLPFTYLDNEKACNTAPEYGWPSSAKELFDSGKLPFVLFSSFILRLPYWYTDPLSRGGFLARLESQKDNDLIQILIALDLLSMESKISFADEAIIKYNPGLVGRFLPSQLLSSEIRIIKELQYKGFLTPQQAAAKARVFTKNQLKHCLRVRAGIQDNIYRDTHGDFRRLPFTSTVFKYLTPTNLFLWLTTLFPDSAIRLADRARKTP
jgi:hypothetical protein